MVLFVMPGLGLARVVCQERLYVILRDGDGRTLSMQSVEENHARAVQFATQDDKVMDRWPLGGGA